MHHGCNNRDLSHLGTYFPFFKGQTIEPLKPHSPDSPYHERAHWIERQRSREDCKSIFGWARMIKDQLKPPSTKSSSNHLWLALNCVPQRHLIFDEGSDNQEWSRELQEERHVAINLRLLLYAILFPKSSFDLENHLWQLKTPRRANCSTQYLMLVKPKTQARMHPTHYQKLFFSFAGRKTNKFITKCPTSSENWLTMGETKEMSTNHYKKPEVLSTANWTWFL